VTSHHLRKLDHDDENEDGPDLPILCSLSWASVSTPEMIQLLPPVVLDEETGTIDYAADQNAFDAYDSYCNSIGGQTLSFDLDFSDECENGSDKVLNYPVCFGSACDDDDIAKFGNFMISNDAADDNPACATSFTVESDGDGKPFGPPGIPNECLEDIYNIFSSDEVYDEDFDEILEVGDGYTESLANFEESCENESGRIVIASVNPNNAEECLSEDDTFTSKPICVAKSCEDEESEIALEFMPSLNNDEEQECADGVTVTIEANPIQDDDDGSKSSKSNKTIPTGRTHFVLLFLWVFAVKYP